MTDREIKRIVTLVKNCIYNDVNDNYSDNLEVLKYALRINEKYIENWVTDILKHKSLWEDPERSCDDCISRDEAITEMEMNARTYLISKEFGGMGQVEWSDNLISIKDALDILRKLRSKNK